MKNYISTNIVHLLKKSSLSQEEFGNFFGLGKGLISNYIHGRALPKVETIQRICLYFKITIDDFINQELEHEREKQSAIKLNASEPVNLKYIELLETTIDDKKKIIQSLEEKLLAKEIPRIQETRDGLKIIDEIENITNLKSVE